MSTLMIPAYADAEEEEWATLGPALCDWIESYLVFGPGDLRGQPARLDVEKKALIYRAYQLFPRDHPQAGRRRFRRVAWSLRKGSAKTELAAWLAACEMHPDAPVRFDKWAKKGDPIGRGVKDPRVIMIAYTEEQSDELAFAALRCTLGEGPLKNDFDIGLTRILRKNGDGKAVSVATAPDSRDGALTTFEVCDESHRIALPRQREAWKTMLANLLKRPASDPWALEITTAYSPGEGSVAETTMDYARQVESGKLKDSRLFFFHRQANDGHSLETREDVTAAVLEASGPVAAWSDVGGIVDQFFEADADRQYLERVWLNRPVRSASRAFDIVQWNKLAVAGKREPSEGALITLGFDGARWHDATALVGTEVETGFQWLAGLWERPEGLAEWETPIMLVTAAIAACFERFEVWLLYGDRARWDTQLAEWANEYGDDRIVVWPTGSLKKTALAIQAYTNAINAGEISHSGDQRLTRHLGAAVRVPLNFVDDEGKPLYLLDKERKDSPHKIDGAYAGFLSWQARLDALAAGATGERSMYEEVGAGV